MDEVFSLALKPTYTKLRSFIQSYTTQTLWHDFILLLSLPASSPADGSESQVDFPINRLLALPPKSQRFIMTAIYETVERSPPSDPLSRDLYQHVLYAVAAFVKGSPQPLDEWCAKLCFMAVAEISRLPDEVLVR